MAPRFKRIYSPSFPPRWHMLQLEGGAHGEAQAVPLPYALLQGPHLNFHLQKSRFHALGSMSAGRAIQAVIKNQGPPSVEEILDRRKYRS